MLRSGQMEQLKRSASASAATTLDRTHTEHTTNLCDLSHFGAQPDGHRAGIGGLATKTGNTRGRWGATGLFAGRSRLRLLPMILAGVSVRNELVQRLAYLVGDSELAGKIERGLDTQQAILPLTAPEREAILVALDDVPDGLEELRDRLRDLERRGAEGR